MIHSTRLFPVVKRLSLFRLTLALVAVLVSLLLNPPGGVATTQAQGAVAITPAQIQAGVPTDIEIVIHDARLVSPSGDTRLSVAAFSDSLLDSLIQGARNMYSVRNQQRGDITVSFAVGFVPLEQTAGGWKGRVTLTLPEDLLSVTLQAEEQDAYSLDIWHAQRSVHRYFELAPRGDAPPAATPGPVTESPIAVFIDGQAYAFDSPPVVREGRTLVPMRALFEALGADVIWEAQTRTAVGTRHGATVRIPLGSTQPTVNGEVRTIDVPAQLIDNRTFIPLRFVGEALGDDVVWDSGARAVRVTRTQTAPVEPAEWLTLWDEPFRILFREGDLAAAEQVADWAHLARQVTADFYPHVLEGEVRIYLHQEDTWDDGAGVLRADPEASAIQFLSPSAPEENERTELWFKHGLIHKYAHITIIRDMRRQGYAPGQAPWWLYEGVAEYIAAFAAGNPLYERYGRTWAAMTQQAVLDGKAGLEGQRSYAVAAYVVKFIVAEWGREPLIALMQSAEPSFVRAVPRELGVTLAELEGRWLTWARDHFGLAQPTDSPATDQPDTDQPDTDQPGAVAPADIPAVVIPSRPVERPTGPWRLTYQVAFEPGSKTAEVQIHLEDPNDMVVALSWQGEQLFGPHTPPPDFVTNQKVTAGSLDSGQWHVRGVRAGVLSFTVKLDVEYRRGGYTGYAADKWVVTNGDFLFRINGYTGPREYPERVLVRVLLPDDWVAYLPYPEVEPGLFDATGIINHMIPRDFLVAGAKDQFETVSMAAPGGAAITVVAPPSGTRAAGPASLAALLAEVAPVYAGIAGWGPGPILSVLVPEPMRRHGGEAIDNSILVSDDNPFPADLSWGSATYTHELFHLYQYHYASETWINEGITTYYQYYGLLRAGHITPAEFWDVLTRVVVGRTSPGRTVAQDPYQRGALVAMAMDILLRQDSGGKYSLDDVIHYLNAAYLQKYVSTATLAEVMTQFTGQDYADFFLHHVLGDQLPTAIFAGAGPDLYK